MAPNSDSEPRKRKRNTDNAGQGVRSDRIPQPPPPQLGTSVCNAAQISYISRANATRLKLIHGDGDTFSEVLTLISEYEGVLNRHESLASNLGAKLTGPRLLKAMEGAFEGTIMTNPSQTAFTLGPCHVVGRNRVREVEPVGILVDAAPLKEDENVEFVTLEILEQRLQILTRKADEVAHRARQLNYQLSGRKAAIDERRSPQASASGFQAVNHIGRGAAPASGYDLNVDLLQQYLAKAPNQSSHSPNRSNSQMNGHSNHHSNSAHRVSSVGSISLTPGTMATASLTPRISAPQPPPSLSSQPSPSYHSEPIAHDVDEEHRALVTARIDKLGRGYPISPPCDRCRRLKRPCLKNLTACQGCTKKHARCVWKGITDDEVARLRGDYSNGNVVVDGDESRDMSHIPKHSRAQENPQPSTKHGDEVGLAAKSANRIAIGRNADEIWRKGFRDPHLQSMDIDIDPRDTITSIPTVETETI
ncbi:hypothetical protein PG985_005852 [Apiospora marii]|uniref:uncharacterized protein n=1 Tax=Apiospora marii TaxID=335849 RepID=UPI00313051E0